MSHNHNHDHASQNIVIAFVLNLVFAVIELIGGLMTNSVAILSDSLHDFGDCISLGVSWQLQRKSKQGRDPKFSYGYRRFSLLGSVFLSGVLAFSSIFILVEAGKRILEPQTVDAHGMLWLAILGIVVNGASALRLKKGHSLNERAVFIHIMEDVLGWVAVLIASSVMIFIDFPILDPILSILITIWVLTNVYKNLRATFRILLQGVPSDVDSIALTTKLEDIDGIDSIHDLHLWTQDGDSHVMTLHVVTDRQDTQAIKEQIRDIAETFKINHSTIEIETLDRPCLHSCD